MWKYEWNEKYKINLLQLIYIILSDINDLIFVFLKSLASGKVYYWDELNSKFSNKYKLSFQMLPLLLHL